MSQPILIFDMMNVSIRQFCANPALDNNGESAGLVIGTLKSIAHLVRQVNPKKVICVWESEGNPRRKRIYPEYKEGRKPVKPNNRVYEGIPDTEENKWTQISNLTKLLKNLPLYQIHVPQCEADDVIAYICKLKYPNEKKIIVSSDKDFYQLLDENTKIWKPGKMIFVNKEDVLNEFNITAENFCVAKAFCGDDSDNIPGVERVGFKTLAKRFTMNQDKVSIEDLVSLSEQLKDDKKAPQIYKNITESVELINRNYRLMKLDSSLISSEQISSINRILEEYKPKNNKIKFLKVFLEAGLNGIDPDAIYNIFGYLIYSSIKE